MGAKEESLPSVGRLHIGRASGSIGSGKYRLFASLGRGGMADVLLGVASGPAGFNKLVVVKRLRPLLAEDPALIQMFLDEARLAARMNHPNVIHTYEIGEGNGAYFIAMEYLEGQPLHEILHALKASDGAVAVRPVVWAKIIRDALAGLHYAHELTDYDGTRLDVVHRDVSPQNIIVTYDGGVKLVDFGIAKASVNTTRTESGIIKGKLAYMAPEQAEPEGGVDRRADIFATGIVLWECLTLRRLITGDAQSAMNKIVDMEFALPSSVRPEVTPALDAIVMRALERNPERRYQTAQEMREALDLYMRSEGIVNDEELGSLVGSLFKGERAEMRAQIHLHMGSNASPREQLAAEPVDGDTVTALAPLPGAPPASRAPVTESARSVRAVHSSQRPVDTRRGLRASVALAVALPLIAAGALFVVGQRATHPDAERTAPARVPPAPSPLAPRAVRLVVTATPTDATLFLDDAELPANPFVASFPADALEHRVRASRAGFVPDAKLVRFDGTDVAMRFDLTRATADAGEAHAASRRSGPEAARDHDGGRPALDDDPWR
jgi:serine/threonine protein kinase